jgi:diadenosine tetraphosphatase ApaH/serine/threonine PP2A family protein phosphatase
VRILVVADVHANLEAFQAVLGDAHLRGGFEVIWSLGDIVGYGPDPNACIALLHELPHLAIAGNHDYAATGELGTEDFNPFAAEAVHWTTSQLTLEEQLWLGNLSAVQIEGEFTLAHGSLIDPIWDYLVSPNGAYEHLVRQTTPYGLIGHTHLPGVFFQTPSGARPADAIDTRLNDQRFVANPGSVGQPRDGDPRAAYALIDTDARRLHFRRVPYDVEITQAKIRAVGLPEYLADRLARGR